MSKRYTTRYGNPGRGGGGRRRGQPPTGVRPLSYGTVSRSERDSSYGGHLARSLGVGNERARNSGAPAIYPEEYLNMVGPDVLCIHSSSRSKTCMSIDYIIPCKRVRMYM